MKKNNRKRRGGEKKEYEGKRKRNLLKK